MNATPVLPKPKSKPKADADTAARLAAQISRLSAVFESATARALAPTGLTRADADVLAALHRPPAHHRRKPSELAAACRLTSGGTANIIRRLTEAGYVTREADGHDGRSAWVQLTDEGAEVAAGALATVATAHSRLLDPVPPTLTGGLVNQLDDVLVRLERDTPDHRIR